MKRIDDEIARRRLERLAWLLDSSISVPGLKAKVGIDPLIGLFPWFGDAIGALLSCFILTEASRLGAPDSVLIKMASNIAIDTIVGAIPIVGDLFDFAWKANQRNVRLLEKYLENPRQTVVATRLFVVILCLLLILFVGVVGMLGFLLVRAVWRLAAGL